VEHMGMAGCWREACDLGAMIVVRFKCIGLYSGFLSCQWACTCCLIISWLPFSGYVSQVMRYHPYSTGHVAGSKVT